MTRHRTLSDYDRSADASPQARQTRRDAGGGPVDPATQGRVLHCGGCWCGAENGHGWPGKAEGRPHPRDWPGRVNGHPHRQAQP